MLVFSTFSPLLFTVSVVYITAFAICTWTLHTYSDCFLVLQALGTEVVNIVPVDVAGQAKAKMFAAVDWSLERWNEEGRESNDNMEEGDGENEVDIPGRDTYEEEEEEEEDDEGDIGEEYAEEEEDYEIQTPRHVPV